MITQTKRLFYLDLVRAVALGCILVVHFNATVTGYFTLPHKLFTSTLPLGIYLGDFGSSLFFMVSGAALGYTVPPDTTAKDFYIKRAGALYPMFWLAWVLCFSVRFVTHPGYYAAAPTWSFLFTVLGLDSFADWQPAAWRGRTPAIGAAAYSAEAQLYLSVTELEGISFSLTSLTPQDFAALYQEQEVLP